MLTFFKVTLHHNGLIGKLKKLELFSIFSQEINFSSCRPMGDIFINAELSVEP